jgi:hypothetical protein
MGSSRRDPDGSIEAVADFAFAFEIRAGVVVNGVGEPV